MPHFKTGQTRHGRKIDEVTLTGSGPYTVPAGATHLSVQMWGGGGGGCAGRSNLSPKRSGAGGGSGAHTYIVLVEDFKKTDTVNFTVGAGGAGATDGRDSGQTGIATSLDTYKRDTTTLVTYSSINAQGGVGASPASSSNNAQGGLGGVTNGGIAPSSNGNTGVNGTNNTVCASGGNGADTPFADLVGIGNGGLCGGGNVAANGSNGVGRGAGGGGGGASGSTTFTGGSGAQGQVVIKAYGYYPPVPIEGLL